METEKQILIQNTQAVITVTQDGDEIDILIEKKAGELYQNRSFSDFGSAMVFAMTYLNAWDEVIHAEWR